MIISAQPLVGYRRGLRGHHYSAYRLLSSQEQFSFPSPLSLLHVIISALIGGLAGDELAVEQREPPTSVLIGGISGLLAAALFRWLRPGRPSPCFANLELERVPTAKDPWQHCSLRQRDDAITERDRT